MNKLYQIVLAGALAAGYGCYTKSGSDLGERAKKHEHSDLSGRNNSEQVSKLDLEEPIREKSREEKKLEDLEKIINASYKIKKESTFKQTLLTQDGTVIGSRYRGGMGWCSAFNFARDKNISYFGTAEHCVQEIKEKKSEDYGGLIKIVESVVREEIHIIKYEYELDKDGKIISDDFGNRKIKETKVARLRELAKDKKTDSAILIGIDLPEKDFKPYNLFIDRNMLMQGQEAYAIGYPHSVIIDIFGFMEFSWGKYVYKGNVVGLGNDPLPFDNKGAVFFSASLTKGMSGGVVAVYHKESLRIAGQNSSTYPLLENTYGFTTGILDLAEKNNLLHLLDTEGRKPKEKAPEKEKEPEKLDNKDKDKEKKQSRKIN